METSTLSSAEDRKALRRGSRGTYRKEHTGRADRPPRPAGPKPAGGEAGSKGRTYLKSSYGDLTMTSNPRFLLAATLLGSLALAPVALAGDEAAPARGPHARHEGGRFANRRHRAMRLLRALDLTDAQKAALKDARTSAEPVRTDMHAKLRALFAQARGTGVSAEDRAKLREQAKAIVTAARASVEPQAQRILGSLTAEQKAKVAEIAAKHGKTAPAGTNVDARLLKGIERLLLMPDRRQGR